LIEPLFIKGGFMPKEKVEKVEKKAPKIYKGYDIHWLKSEVDHPDHKLVLEYENKYGEVK